MEKFTHYMKLYGLKKFGRQNSCNFTKNELAMITMLNEIVENINFNKKLLSKTSIVLKNILDRIENLEEALKQHIDT